MALGTLLSIRDRVRVNRNPNPRPSGVKLILFIALHLGLKLFFTLKFCILLFLLPEQYTGITDIDILFPLFLRKYIFSSLPRWKVKLKLLSNLSSPNTDQITFSDENTQNSVHAPLQAKRRFAYPSTCETRPFRGTEVAYEHGKWRRREDEEAMKRGRENGLAPVEIMKKSRRLWFCLFVRVSHIPLYLTGK